MTERSGLAASAPNTNQTPTPMTNKNRFATPQSGLRNGTGQALAEIPNSFVIFFGKKIELRDFARTVLDPKSRRVHMARHFKSVYEVNSEEGHPLNSSLKKGSLHRSMRQYFGRCLRASCEHHPVPATTRWT